MGFWDRVKVWLSAEGRELSQAKQNLEGQLDQELTRREQRLDETPAQAMERLQAEAEANDDLFGDLQAKIEGREAKADAVADLAEDGNAPDDNTGGDTDTDTAGDETKDS